MSDVKVYEIKSKLSPASLSAPSRSQWLGLLELAALGSDVGLGVGAWDTWGGAEVSLGFSVLGSSKEESIGTYYNI